MKVVDGNFPTKKEEPEKQSYVFELYNTQKDGPAEKREHYGFLSYGEFVAVIDSPAKPIAMYPYGRVAGITVNETKIG